jgi:hypothetical protein
MLLDGLRKLGTLTFKRASGSSIIWCWRCLKVGWYSGIYMEGLRKTTWNLSQDSRSPGPDLDPVSPEYDPGVSTIRSWYFSSRSFLHVFETQFYFVASQGSVSLTSFEWYTDCECDILGVGGGETVTGRPVQWRVDLQTMESARPKNKCWGWGEAMTTAVHYKEKQSLSHT